MDNIQTGLARAATAIAERWAALVEAADSGDAEAREFLETFEPWAVRRLSALPHH